ncbi:MAG TPA: hypothetical protein VE616_06615 [Candidatus Udaeobacter sp.]|jgi:hypothetical protein|nr:hypothetical protein [Candidatus Udaeobacter sp.]
MKRLVACILTVALGLWLCGQASAGGAGVAGRLGNPAGSAKAKSAVQQSLRYGAPVVPGYPYYWYYVPRTYYRQPVIAVPPYTYPYYYPYYVPSTLVVSSPFFCLAHHVGYVSRIGMLDHLNGTHKIPLETAVHVCPEGNETCIIDGY